MLDRWDRVLVVLATCVAAACGNKAPQKKPEPAEYRYKLTAWASKLVGHDGKVRILWRGKQVLTSDGNQDSYRFEFTAPRKAWVADWLLDAKTLQVLVDTPCGEKDFGPFRRHLLQKDYGLRHKQEKTMRKQILDGLATHVEASVHLTQPPGHDSTLTVWYDNEGGAPSSVRLGKMELTLPAGAGKTTVLLPDCASGLPIMVDGVESGKMPEPKKRAGLLINPRGDRCYEVNHVAYRSGLAPSLPGGSSREKRAAARVHQVPPITHFLRRAPFSIKRQAPAMYASAVEVLRTTCPKKPRRR